MNQERKELIKKLDRLCSEIIRRRAIQRVGGCERCLKAKKSYKELDWAHFIGRKNHRLRWDLENAAGCCGGCHMYLDQHPIEKVEWFTRLLGQDRVNMLRARERYTGKQDLELIYLYLKSELEGVR